MVNKFKFERGHSASDLKSILKESNFGRLIAFPTETET